MMISILRNDADIAFVMFKKVLPSKAVVLNFFFTPRAPEIQKASTDPQSVNMGHLGTPESKQRRFEWVQTLTYVIFVVQLDPSQRLFGAQGSLIKDLSSKCMLGFLQEKPLDSMTYTKKLSFLSLVLSTHYFLN
jgi:hypothetical protein